MDTPDALQATLSADYIIHVGDRTKIPENSRVFIPELGKLLVIKAMRCPSCEFANGPVGQWPCNPDVITIETWGCGFSKC